MVQQLPSNETGNKTFCLQFVGVSVDMADLFVLAGTKLENPVAESGTKTYTLIL